ESSAGNFVFVLVFRDWSRGGNRGCRFRADGCAGTRASGRRRRRGRLSAHRAGGTSGRRVWHSRSGWARSGGFGGGCASGGSGARRGGSWRRNVLRGWGGRRFFSGRSRSVGCLRGFRGCRSFRGGRFVGKAEF